MTKRKTAAESRAQEFSMGFSKCMEIIEREWRRRTKLHLAQGAPNAPVMADLWPIIEKMQATAGLYDDDYKELMIPRVHGVPFQRLRYRVKLRRPHPHAGASGFVLWSKAFEVDGMYPVHFFRLAGPGVDNVRARRDQWYWIDLPVREYRNTPWSPEDEDD